MAATVADLDDRVLRRYYDAGSFQRGQGYAADDRIRLLTTGDGAIDAACKGSGTASYVVRVRWGRDRDGVHLDDTCTCPLGGACKHAVAAILTARRDAARRPTPGLGARSDRRSGEWRRLLGGLEPERGDDLAPEPLALQVALHRPSGHRHTLSTGPRPTIRPMRLGRAGRWIKSGASWRDITASYSYRLDDVDPTHLAVLRAMLASAPRTIYPDDQPLELDRFGPDLWHQLARARDVGIELIATRGEDHVELSPTAAQAQIDLVADDDGGVAIAAALTHHDEPLPLGTGHAGPIGFPAHGAWRADDAAHRLLLIPLDRPLHRTIAHLIEHGPVVVPAEDVDELLDSYGPELAQHAEVTSSDATVTLTTKTFDRIVAVIDRPALDVAHLRWTARYQRGDRPVDHPLLQRAGRHRDHVAEATALADLNLPTHLLAAIADDDGNPRDVTARGPDAIALLTEVAPWLEAIGGIPVEITGDQPTLREAEAAPQISVSVDDGDPDRAGNDWFDLAVEVTVDGQQVDFASLFAALHQDATSMILPSGTILRLDQPELTKLRDLIDEARGLIDPDGDGAAKVNRFQASWWEELVSLGVVDHQSARWAESVDAMAELAAPEPVDPPAGLQAELRHYQQDGLDWLAFLHRHRLGGILGDDMGLGKTVQTLALALHVLDQQPDARFLVVAPTSVVENWAREAARFAPDLAVATIGETAKRRGTPLADAVGDASLVITSYALFRIDFDEYDAIGWEVLLLDEAQFVKNHTSKAYRCARRLDAATKVAMTGTPMENSLMDLWSLLSITAPGLFPDPKRFSETYRKPIERGDHPELLDTLRRRIAPLLRRRTKDEVLRDLPPKTEQVVEIELSAKHARRYATQLQRQRQKVLGLVDDTTKHRFEILRSLTILRQLALDPGLVDKDDDHLGSAKLDRLLDDLETIVAEGHRALVFSQFTRFLGKVRGRLDDAGIAYAYLDGRTRKRDEAIAAFKDGDAPVFLISLKAGGFGLNLTEADYVFILDPWWNPATETQAVDRTHRIGQTNPVVVYRYVSVDTIEEKVMELKARKADLFANVMDAEGALSGALTDDDIRGLLDLA